MVSIDERFDGDLKVGDLNNEFRGSNPLQCLGRSNALTVEWV